MGFFDKLKKTFFEEEQPQEIDKGKYSAALVENEVVCNGCGEPIENNPRFLNHNGRKMFFHKRCFKKLKNGQLP